MKNDRIMQKSERLSWKNLRLVVLESAVTAGLLAMSIMSPFFLSIGLSQVEIALSQSIFTLGTIVLNLPTGWLADRFSRKWANVIGDFGHAVVLLCYATAQTFFDVVLYETLAAFFLSLSKGVDMSLLKHFSKQINPDESFFRQQAAKLSVLSHLCTLVLVFLGGPVSAISFRLAIAASSIPYWIGGVATLLINDDSQKLVSQYQNPLRDILRIVSTSLQNRRLRLRIAAYAVGREMTHGIIWVFTPMLILVGVPLPVVSCAWALNSLACIAGAKIATKFAAKMQDWQIFLVPLALMAISMGTLSLWLSCWTVWIYLLMGLMQGWTSATLSPMVQRYVADEEQTSVLSFTSIVSNLLYAPVVWLIGLVADFDLRYAALATLTIFGLLGIVLLMKLLRE